GPEYRAIEVRHPEQRGPGSGARRHHRHGRSVERLQGSSRLCADGEASSSAATAGPIGKARPPLGEPLPQEPCARRDVEYGPGGEERHAGRGGAANGEQRGKVSRSSARLCLDFAVRGGWPPPAALCQAPQLVVEEGAEATEPRLSVLL